MSKLALFDLDGTLLSTQGVGMRAMSLAGSTLWGENFNFDGMNSAGALDPHLFAAAAQRCGVECNDENQSIFRDRYCEYLREQLQVSAADGTLRALPGVLELLDAVHAHGDVVLGILTGNYTLTAPVKLAAAGIDPSLFIVGAFGDDAATRPELVPVAIDRYKHLKTRVPEPNEVLLIGDTPKDIQAAAAHGCLSLGVATGPYTVADLNAAGATLAVEDLADPAPFWELLGVAPPAAQA